MRPQQPVGKAVAVPDRIAECKARGLPRLLQFLAKIQIPGVIVRNTVEAGGLDKRFAIDQGTCGCAERQPDPCIAGMSFAVLLGQEHPAAIALAEVVGDVGQFDQLVGVDVGSVRETHDDVGAGTAVRRHGGLLVDVLPTDEIDLDLDTGLFGEFRRIGAEHILIRLHEPHGAQHAQAGAFFEIEFWGGNVDGLDGRCGLGRRAGRGQCRGRNAQDERVATRDLVAHASLPNLFKFRR